MAGLIVIAAGIQHKAPVAVLMLVLVAVTKAEVLKAKGNHVLERSQWTAHPCVAIAVVEWREMAHDDSFLSLVVLDEFLRLVIAFPSQVKHVVVVICPAWHPVMVIGWWIGCPVPALACGYGKGVRDELSFDAKGVVGFLDALQELLNGPEFIEKNGVFII